MLGTIFAQIFRDFAQIFSILSGFSGILPRFSVLFLGFSTNQNLWGCAFIPTLPPHTPLCTTSRVCVVERNLTASVNATLKIKAAL